MRRVKPPGRGTDYGTAGLCSLHVEDGWNLELQRRIRTDERVHGLNAICNFKMLKSKIAVCKIHLHYILNFPDIVKLLFKTVSVCVRRLAVWSLKKLKNIGTLRILA